MSIHQKNRCKGVANVMSTLKYLWIDPNKRELARCKTMNSYLYSRHTSSQSRV